MNGVSGQRRKSISPGSTGSGRKLPAVLICCCKPAEAAKNNPCGHIALRAMIGYLDLRFAGQWDKGRAKLKRWAALR
jgi:hypothetical protein